MDDSDYIHNEYEDDHDPADDSDIGARSIDDQPDGINALNLKWVLGFNKDLICGVHNLSSEERREIFYSAAHTGVIYNYETREQKLLQGHCNKITATAVSADKKWIVTADTGIDSMLVVWESYSGTPFKTIFNPHQEGVCAVDISPDSSFIVTLSSKIPQSIILWDWSKEESDRESLILARYEIPPGSQDLQTCVRFNPYNPHEIASNGKIRVIFWSWNEESDMFDFYSPAFKKKYGPFTQTVFIPNSTQAVTGTQEGDIVVWDISLIQDTFAQPDERRAIKIVNLNKSPNQKNKNNVLVIQDDYLVVGTSDGSIRFYDFKFRVVAWFEDIKTNEIMSISFANMEPRKSPELDYGSEDSFACPDFIVADSSALVYSLQSTLFDEIDIEKKKGELVLQGLDSPINAIAVHPKEPYIAIAGKAGFIHCWNYLHRTTVLKRLKTFDKETPICMEYSPDGKYLCVGFANGTIHVLHPLKLEELQGTLKVSETKSKPITSIVFANDSMHMATMDMDMCVCLFKIGHRHGDPEKEIEWVFSGKHRSHYKRITSIAFGDSLDENGNIKLKLFSIGEDRKMVEYDVQASTEHKGLIVKSHTSIEQEAIPTSCIWYPLNNDKEDILLTMNSEYKIKMWNANNKGCRQTCIGPTYGGAINKLKLVQFEEKADKYLAYSTDEKVVGLLQLPVDGNPNKTMGLIAHPDKVADISVSADGKYFFTCGGDDLAVNMWLIDVNVIEQTVMMGGEGIEPFISLIEGGREGQTYQDMKDFFYYSQIRSQNENTKKSRKLDGTVPLKEMANLMRAMGYYPSEQEVENMKNEVKYSRFIETGEYVDSLDMETFVKLFVNHRPVYGIGKHHIEEALKVLTDVADGDAIISRDTLVDMLLNQGEPMSPRELKACLGSLLGEGTVETALPDDINSAVLAEQVLGFEEVEEYYDEEGEGPVMSEQIVYERDEEHV